MFSSATLFVICAAAYAGFQWTVHVVVYPQFAAVPAESFAGYERGHQRRISAVVGPLFAVLVVSTGWLVADPPGGVGIWAVVVAAVGVAVILGVTAFVAVPLHRRLSAGWDLPAHRDLMRADLVRTVAASVVLAIGVVLAVAGSG